jgi:glutamine amidotransferase-like uncharacterized protein
LKYVIGKYNQWNCQYYYSWNSYKHLSVLVNCEVSKGKYIHTHIHTELPQRIKATRFHSNKIDGISSYFSTTRNKLHRKIWNAFSQNISLLNKK